MLTVLLALVFMLIFLAVKLKKRVNHDAYRREGQMQYMANNQNMEMGTCLRNENQQDDNIVIEVVEKVKDNDSIGGEHRQVDLILKGIPEQIMQDALANPDGHCRETCGLSYDKMMDRYMVIEDIPAKPLVNYGDGSGKEDIQVSQVYEDPEIKAESRDGNACHNAQMVFDATDDVTEEFIGTPSTTAFGVTAL